MNKFMVEYSAGFGDFEYSHSGFGPTIYKQEKIIYKSDKNYFDFVDFFNKYFNNKDTYFYIKLLEDRELSQIEKDSQKQYLKLRDEKIMQIKNKQNN